MGALAAALLSAGPSLIRAAGSLIGGDAKEIAGRAADAVSVATGSDDPQAEMDRQLAGMTPEQVTALGQIKTQLAQIEADRANAQTQAALQGQQTVNETFRTEVQNGRGRWRDFIGYILGAGIFLMMAALCWVLVKDPSQIDAVGDTIIWIVISVAPLLGVNISRDARTREAAMTGQQTTGLLDAVAQRVAKRK